MTPVHDLPLGSKFWIWRNASPKILILKKFVGTYAMCLSEEGRTEQVDIFHMVNVLDNTE